MLATRPLATLLIFLDVFKLLFLVLLETIVPRSRAIQPPAFAILSTALLLCVIFRFVLPRMVPWFVTITICVPLTVVSMTAVSTQQLNVENPTVASLLLVLLQPDVPPPPNPRVTITTHVPSTLAATVLDASTLQLFALPLEILV
jgi:hypothetical protein